MKHERDSLRVLYGTYSLIDDSESSPNKKDLKASDEENLPVVSAKPKKY